MKISPLAQGTGVSATSSAVEGTITPSKIERAKAIASGHPLEAAIPEPPIVQTENPIPDTNEPAVVAEETKPLSPQFAALAKAKRALQVKERELAQREAQLKNQSPAGNEDLISKLKANPLSVMLENGVTYDQLTEAIMAQQNGATPEIIALKAELAALKEHVGNQFTQRDQFAEQQVLADLTREAKALTAQGDTFEAVRAAEAESQVVKLVHRVYKNGWPEQGYKPGEVMDLEKAAEFVENQLIDEAVPFAKLSKVQSRLTPKEAAQVEVQLPSTPKPNTKVMRTLTNRDTASPIIDRRSRAIAAMQGTLKKG